jgi:hypothetical protein
MGKKSKNPLNLGAFEGKFVPQRHKGYPEEAKKSERKREDDNIERTGVRLG